MRVDPHVHTMRSGHSLLKPEKIAKVARKRGIEAVAITDHDDIRSAMELSKEFPTIVGEEISSDQGDIIGLFLSEHVAKGPAAEVMDRIRLQGGLVVMPHPFDSLRKEAVMSEEICAEADIIEVFNSRVVRSRDNDRAKAFAESRSMPQIVGSDAHTSLEVGRSWVELDSIDTPTGFLKSLDGARTVCRRSPTIIHLQTKALKTFRRVVH